MIPRWHLIVLNFALAVVVGLLAGLLIDISIQINYQPGAGAYPIIQDANPINQPPAPAYFTPESGDMAVQPPVVPQERTEAEIQPTVPEQRKIVTTGIRRVAVYYLDATCYHRWADSQVGYSRMYANHDLVDLPESERWLQEYHYTVAMNYAMDDMHRALVTLPDGQVTHKYRVHVPSYNSDYNHASDHYRGQLADFNGSYFSVPRDRMPAYHRGRIDILFTGCKQACEAKVNWWGKRFMPVEIWEIYSEGQQ